MSPFFRALMAYSLPDFLYSASSTLEQEVSEKRFMQINLHVVFENICLHCRVQKGEMRADELELEDRRVKASESTRTHHDLHFSLSFTCFMLKTLQQTILLVQWSEEQAIDAYLSKVTSSQHWNVFEVFHLQSSVPIASHYKRKKKKKRTLLLK